ncbi:MAG: hypothetical protein OQJ98_03020 [Candidatus Pacebacteria bacterium]|nr:hypothetical protein [Candidatus Paceibacterota bacterium]
MKTKIISLVVVVLTLILSGCVTNQTGQPRVADTVSQDCTFSNSTYGGERVYCRGKAALSGVDARRAVEESRRANGVQSLFGGVVQVRSYPGYVTTSKWQREHYGYPKYMPRNGGYHYHVGGHIGTR